MILTVELYKTDSGLGAWIADDQGGSGIEVNGSDAAELSEHLNDYISDYCYEFENSLTNN